VDIYVVELGDQGLTAPPTAEPRILVSGEYQQRNVRISPDGRYAAYESNETSTYQVYVTRFPSGDGKWQLTRDSVGLGPKWNGKSDRLVFAAANVLMEIQIDTSAGFSASSPAPLFSLREHGMGMSLASEFELTPDLARFLLPRPTSEFLDSSKIIFVQNWIDAYRGASR
jgi:Tol biopolymer transport system component